MKKVHYLLLAALLGGLRLGNTTSAACQTISCKLTLPNNNRVDLPNCQ